MDNRASSYRAMLNLLMKFKFLRHQVPRGHFWPYNGDTWTSYDVEQP